MKLRRISRTTNQAAEICLSAKKQRKKTARSQKAKRGEHRKARTLPTAKARPKTTQTPELRKQRMRLSTRLSIRTASWAWSTAAFHSWIRSSICAARSRIRRFPTRSWERLSASELPAPLLPTAVHISATAAHRIPGTQSWKCWLIPCQHGPGTTEKWTAAESISMTAISKRMPVQMYLTSAAIKEKQSIKPNPIRKTVPQAG